MADSDETRSSRTRGAERQEQQEQEQQAEQAGPREEQQEAVRRRIAENGYAGADRDAGFTEEWAQQREQRAARRQDQV